MPHPYYQLPIRIDLIIQKKAHPRCDLKTSIAQNLHLLISSYRGESSYSHEFGFSLWDEEFNIQENPRIKEDIIQSLKVAITKFEKRIEYREAKANIEEQSQFVDKGLMRVRRCLHIEVQGTIKSTNEPIVFRDFIYLSPIAQK